MYTNDTGKDPDFENIESGDLTFTLRLANNPEHMAWIKREAALEMLAFGAKSPDETYNADKPLITPLKPRLAGPY